MAWVVGMADDDENQADKASGGKRRKKKSKRKLHFTDYFRTVREL